LIAKARTKGRRKQLRFIDLFAGCGGLSLGLMSAGWRGVLAVEKDGYAFETLRANLIDTLRPARFDWPAWLPKEAHEIGRFISDYRGELKELAGTVDLIAGGPPCQGFSFAGRRAADDPRNQLFEHYLEVVNLVKAPFLILENVAGITVPFQSKITDETTPSTGPSMPYSALIIARLEGLGYRIWPQTLKAVDFGVPQLRPRYIMIAVHESLLVGMGKIDPHAYVMSNQVAFLTSKGLPTKRPVTVGQAISDLEVRHKAITSVDDAPGFKQIVYQGPRTVYQRLMHGAMNGTSPNSMRLANHRKHTVKRFRQILRTCRPGTALTSDDRLRLKISKHVLVPLDRYKPSHTLTTLPDDLLHYSEPRILTVREYARLQSFPDWFEFKGNYTTGGERRRHECPRYSQIGNAVPPLLAEILGIALREVAVELLQAQLALAI
jgi:DNA (cytosine-5)-methyltransferase 1